MALVDESEKEVFGIEISNTSKNESSKYVYDVVNTTADTFRETINRYGLLQSHHEDASSALLLCDKYFEEEKTAQDVAWEYQKLQPSLDSSWNSICIYLLQKLLEDCNQNLPKGEESIIDHLKSQLTKHFSQSPTTIQNCDDLMQCGRIFASFDLPVHSIVSLYACAKMNKLRAHGDSSVDQIQKCSWLMTFAFENLAEDRRTFNISVLYLIPHIFQEITKFVRSVQTSTHTFRTENEAWCMMRMGMCYGCYGDDVRYASTCETAISLVRRKFRKDARFHQVFATCLSNAAVAHMRCRNLEKADELFARAAEAYDKVRDWQGSDKDDALSILKFNMKIKSLSDNTSLSNSLFHETEV